MIDQELVNLMVSAERRGYQCLRQERFTLTEHLLPLAMDMGLDTLSDTPAYNPVVKREFNGKWLVIERHGKRIASIRINDAGKIKKTLKALINRN